MTKRFTEAQIVGPRPDPEFSLRDRSVALAHRHRRYGAGMIDLKLRQEGRRVRALVHEPSACRGRHRDVAA
jgi:hypothetical protein